jgi:hypothetical protein
MSYSISTLLTRNLHEVFGENDPERRRAAIDEIFTEDCVFYDPTRGVYRGRDEIDRVAGAIKATHPDFRYQPIGEPEESGNGGRIQWVSGRPGEAPAYAGTDFIIARDGRIAAFISFSTSYPEQHSDLSQIKTFGGGSADRTEIERCALRHSIVFPHCQFFS